jgi:hypothetical protein
MATAPSSADTLKALLGDRFLCAACKRHHNPDSRLIHVCERQLSSQYLLRDQRYSSWAPFTRHYYQRLEWYTAQRRLTESETTIIEQLLTEIQHQAVYNDFGHATLTELASPNPAPLLLARYEQWRQTTDAQIAQARADSNRLIQHLEALLPLPYPVEPPTGRYRDDQHRWTPDPSSQAEIDRVASLFTPSATIRRFEQYMILAGPMPPALPTIRRYSSNRIDPNLLGLDQTFWRPATLSNNRLQLRTHFFTLTQQDPTPRSLRSSQRQIPAHHPLPTLPPQQQTPVQLSLFE